MAQRARPSDLSPRPLTLRIDRLARDDMAAAALVHRAAFDERLPWLSGRHTPEQDLGYFRNHVFDACAVWGAFEGEIPVGFIAFRQRWVDQLYILPARQGRGLGSGLLEVARRGAESLRLWTFQKNTDARRFYEGRGFVGIEMTDGSRNEEREPDVLYEWRAAT